ncbi:glycosyltransferase family 39 protein [Candidatus Collierbacteria bacterium]|nr:glycosyltransferase family 39 protein [Candidatus Collierbacteria bacterium]
MGKKIKYYLLLSAIILLGFVVRLYRIDFPLADWHSWRQVDTAGVTREFVKNGIDLLHPKYMDLSSIPSGKDNPFGWRMVELPFINGLVAAIIQSLGGLNAVGGLEGLVKIERLTSIIFSLGSIWLLYLIVNKFNGRQTAILAAAVLTFLPFNIYYSRTVLPEPKLMFFSLLASWGMIGFIFEGRLLMWFVGVTASIGAVLLKPVWLFIYGPALFYLSIVKFQFNLRKWWWLFTAAIITFLPFILWRLWIQQFPEGIPASAWLFNGDGIRFRPAWFRWLFMDRLGRLILGYWGLFLFGLGWIVKHSKKEGWFFDWWGFGSLAYLIIIATGNIRHDYYQSILAPVVAVFVAKGMYFLISIPKEYFSKSASYGFLAIGTVFMLGFSWFQIRDYFNINHPEIIEAGLAADKILPADARIVAPYGGDTAFLFQVNRLGWPLGGAIDDKISKGATHYISVNFDEETNGLMDKCQSLLKTDKYVIIDLKACK